MSLIFYLINVVLISMVILYILRKLYFKQGMKQHKEERINVYNLITWIIFFALLCLSNILKCISLAFIINGQNTEALIILILFRIRIVIIYTAFLVKILYLEYVLKTQKIYKGYFFSIILSIVIVILILVDPAMLKTIGTSQIIFIILIFTGYSLLPILYFYLAIKTVGQSRKNALKVSAGAVFLGLGCLFRPENLGGYMGFSKLLDILIGYTYITAPIGMIISTLLIFDSFRERKK
ncbi:MAG: hypothetical protein ACTSQS_17480 [Promethearchaeota archaeon]